MLLICPVRPGDRNEELRFALRSWETNLVLPGGLELLTVGYKPTWLTPDRHVPGNFYRSMPLAVFDNIRLGSIAAMDYPEAVYMNDDFFCLDPTSAVVPVKRNVTLAQHIAKFPASAGVWWPRSLRLTASWLSEQGFPHPDSYEVHRPLPAQPEAMAKTLLRWEGGMTDTVPQWRTMYGVINGLEAYPVLDVKTGVGKHQPSAWMSTSDENWRMYAQVMRKRFQKPSRWETDAN